MQYNNFINRITISGCKGIKEPLTINFSNSTFGTKKDFIGSNFKGIYGANSTNKSSIILAMYIYKWAIVSGTHNGELEELIKKSVHKDCKEMKISVVYSIPLAGSTINVYNHTLVISNEAKVTFESIDVLQGKYIVKDKFKTLVRLEKGKLKEIFSIDEELNQKVIEEVNKVNVDQSIIRLFELIKNMTNPVEIFTNPSLSAIAKIGKSIFDIYVYIGNNFRYYPINSFKNRLCDIVAKEDLDTYRSLFANIANFLSAFDKNLVSIDLVETKIDEKTYEVAKEFNYGSYKLTYSELSKSDQKLYSIFPLLYKCFNGAIVFIDDLTESISDLAANKLLSYLIKKSKGQLIFTSSSEAGIDALKANSHSIDFIYSDDVESFKKTGNVSPLNKYRKENEIDENDLMVAFELFL